MKMNINNRRLQSIRDLMKITGMNFSVSGFVPRMACGQITDVAFLYPSSTASTVRTRPFARVVFEHKTGVLLEYTNCYLNDFMDTERYPMDTKINYTVDGVASVVEMKQNLDKLNGLYEEVCSAFSQNDPAGGETAVTFMEAFYKTVPKDTLVFYKELSPEFFDWADKFKER